MAGRSAGRPEPCGRHVDGGSPAAAARRMSIARTTRRSSARPVSRRPAGSTLWKSAAFGSSSPGRLDVGIEAHRRTVVGRHVVPLSALLVEPEPAPDPLPEVVLPPHPEDRAHPREAVEHDREERPVPEGLFYESGGAHLWRRRRAARSSAPRSSTPICFVDRNIGRLAAGLFVFMAGCPALAQPDTEFEIDGNHHAAAAGFTGRT